MLKSLTIESLIEASAVQSLVGCTRLYGLHKALQAVRSPIGCSKSYRLYKVLQTEQSLTG
jgi:hypothetical protein